MKHALPAMLGLLCLATPGLADVTLVPATQALAELRAAYGKQIDVHFSDAFAKDRLAKPDVDGVIVYGLTADKLCLYGQGKGLEAAAPGLAAFASPDGGGDICVPLAEVSVRVAPHEPVDGASPVPFYATDKTAPTTRNTTCLHCASTTASPIRCCSSSARRAVPRRFSPC